MPKQIYFDIKVRRTKRLQERSKMNRFHNFLNKQKSQKVLAGLGIVALLVLTIGVLPSPQAALAATGGPNAGSTFSGTVTGTGTVDWSNASNVASSDNTYATVALASGASSHYLEVTGFNLSIPAGSTINGITVKVEHHASVDTTTGSHKNSIADNSIKLVNGGAVAGTEEASGTAWGTSDSTATYGSTSNTWGLTLGASDVNASNFGVAISAKQANSNTAANTASVDFVSVSIDYTSNVTPGTNPSLTNGSCGLDIALVLDNSGSIGTDLSTMKTDFNNFVGTLLPATPTEFSVTYFNTLAHYTLQTFSGTASTVTAGINNVPAATGSTNWEEGLNLANATFDPRPSVPNLIVFASDGDPNRYNNPAQGTGSGVDVNALNAAITEANTIKSSGTRIITLGIGSSVNQTNLEDISSADAYYSASNFTDLGTQLQNIAEQLCGGTITGHKIIDTDGNLDTTHDQAAGQGWTINIGGTPEVTDANGNTQSVNLTNGSYTVGEVNQAGYTELSGSCSNGNDNDGTFNIHTGNVENVTLGTNDIVSCTFINSPNAGTLTVIKNVIDGFGSTAGSADFTIDVSGGATPSSFPGANDSGTSVSVPANASYSVTEDPSTTTGFIPSFEGDCSGTMTAGGNATCTITNTQADPHADQGSLTVTKVVTNNNGGTKQVGDFTLMVNGNAVTSGVSAFYDPNTYTITEGDLTGTGYHQDSITCDNADVQTTDGTVTIAAGDTASCTVTNNDIAPSLTLIKNVVGNASASNWTLSATMSGSQSAAISGAGGATSDGTFQAGSYTLSESSNNTEATTNYTPGSWQCTGVSNDGDSITLAIGQSATCTITNTFQAPTPTTTFNFYKEICGSYGDINGNAAQDQLMDPAAAANIAKYKNAGSFPSVYPNKPIDPTTENEFTNDDCSGASGWSFFLSTDQAQTQNTQTVSATNNSGLLAVPFSSLNAAIQTALTSGQTLWVSEVEQSGVATFGAVRCYEDALNGDNLEQISFGNSTMPSTVNCIAYNVGTPTPPPPVCTNVTDMLTNGDFETPVVTTAQGWDIAPSGTTAGLGWTVAWNPTDATTFDSVTRPPVANLELQNSTAVGFAAAHGNQYTELDSDWDGPTGSLSGEPANVLITQTVPTVSGASYALTFSYAPRPGVADNSMDVLVNGSTVANFTVDGTVPANQVWATHTENFTGDGNPATIGFEEVGTADSLGSFLDNTSLSQNCNTCPEGEHPNSDHVCVTDTSTSDLSITKMIQTDDGDVTSETVNQNDSVTFDITVTNNGPDDDSNVVVNDLLPGGLAFVSDTASEGSYDNTTGIWTVGSLANTASATLEITVTDNGEAGSQITNTATTSDNSNSANNSASATVSVAGGGGGGCSTNCGGGGNPLTTDPGITKTVDNGNPVVGDTITYTLTVTEASANNDTNVVATDVLPSTVTYVSNDAATAALGTTATFNSGTDTITWNIPALTAGQSLSMHIQATVNTGVSGSIVNTASVTSPTDSNTLNDSATATANVGGGGSSGGGGGGGGGNPNPPVIPTVLGASTTNPNPGQVLGASTTLPRTGNGIAYIILLGMIALFPLALSQSKKKS